MNRICYSLLLCGLAINMLQAQVETGLWFLPEASQANLLNPAYTGEKKLVIGLPSVGFTLSNSAIAFQDAFLGPEGSDLDVGPLVDQLNDKMHARSWMNLRAFSLGVKVGRAQVGLEYHVKALGFLSLNKELAQLLWYGNGTYIDQTLDLDPDLQLTAWQDLALRFSVPLGNKIRLGARLHYLGGIADLSSGKHDLSFYTNPEYYQVELETDYLLRSSLDLDIENIDSAFNISSPFGLGNNPGYTLDLGAHIPIGDQLSLGLSVLNLGSITWQTQPKAWEAQGKYTFDGVHVGFYSRNGEFGFGNFEDSLRSAIQITEDIGPYSTNLPVRAIAGLTWTPEDWVRVGLMYERESFRNQINNAIGLHAGVNVQKILYVGVNYTYESQYQNQLGAQVMLQAGPVQFLIMSSNAIGAFRYWEARTANLRVGMNLAFGKANWQKEEIQASSQP